MKLIRITLLLSLALACACSNKAPIKADYLVTNANVIPMNKEAVLYDQSVAIKDGVIIDIYPSGKQDRGIAGNTINADGKFLMPGLADMHSHMRMPAQAMFNLMIANGVTTTAHMRLADGDKHVENCEAIKRGEIIGPRYIVGGPMLSHENLDSLDKVKPMLNRHIDEGYDFVKIHDDLDPIVFDALLIGARERGLRVTGHTQRLRPLNESLHMNSIEHIEEFLYVTRDGVEAKPGNFKAIVAAYLNNIENLKNKKYRQSLAQEVANSGVHITPTLIIYEYIALYLDDDRFNQLQNDSRISYLPKAKRDTYLDWNENQYRKNFFTGFGPLVGLSSNEEVANHVAQSSKILSLLTKDFHDAGVPLLLGTDSFGAVIPGFSIHQELELLVDAGLSPYQALRTGTINIAQFLGEEKDTGSIEVGKQADFILLGGNPLENIDHTRSISGVFSHNQWHTQSDIARLKSEALALIKAAD